MTQPALVTIDPPKRLDLGCGKNKAAGFIGVDSRRFDGVDLVVDLCARASRGDGLLRDEMGRVMGYGGTPTGPVPFSPWPWESDSVDEIRASHFLEHLEPAERIHFANECFRILVPGGSMQIITPHWASCRAYGDLTHKWPPVSEFWFHYLNKEWRDREAPHNDGYTCDFDIAGNGYGLNPGLHARNEDYRQFALSWYKEAATDLVVTLKKREAK